MERDDCPRTSRSFVPKFSDVGEKNKQKKNTPPGVHPLAAVTRLWTLLRNILSVVYFALSGSAVEILKEWNVTGKKKVRVRGGG